MKIGKKYQFNVLSLHDRHSILENEFGQFYYPRKLCEIGRDLELEVEDIRDGKVYLKTDFIDSKKVNLKYLKKKDVFDHFGIIVCELNAHVFEVNVAKWMMADSFIFNDTILCKLEKRDRNYYFTAVFSNLEHPKYIFGEKYLFDIIDFDSNTNLIKIQDPETKEFFRSKSHFSSSNIKLEKKEFKFIGYNNLYDLKFLEDSTSFLSPDDFFSESELDSIMKDYLVEFDLFNQFKNQIKQEDNLWVISLSRYLVTSFKPLILRGDIDIANTFIDIKFKLNGFLQSRSFLSAMPKSLSFKYEQNLKKYQEFKQILDFYNDNNSFNDLVTIKDGHLVNEKLQVIIIVLRNFGLSLINTEDLYEVFAQLKNSKNIDTSNIDNLITLYFHLFANKVFDRLVNTFYFNQNELNRTVSNLKISIHLKIIYLIKDEFEENYSRYKFNIISSIFNFLLLKNKTIEDVITVFRESISSEKYENKNNFTLLDRNDSLLIFGSKNQHLLRFYKGENFNVNKTYSLSESIAISEPIFLKPDIFGEVKLEVGMNLRVIVKSNVGNSSFNSGIFVTYDFDEKKQESIDGILSLPHYIPYIEKFCPEGSVIEVTVKHINAEGKLSFILYNKSWFNYKFFFNLNDRYEITEREYDNLNDKDDVLIPRYKIDGEEQSKYFNLIPLKKTYEAEIVKKMFNKCPNCYSSTIELENFDTQFKCHKCGRKDVRGLYLYLKNINQIIFVNHKNIFDVYGSEFIRKARLGQIFNFYLESFTEWNFRGSSHSGFTRKIAKLSPSEIIQSGSGSNSNSISSLFLLHNLLNILGIYNLNDDSINSFNYNLSSLIKSPKSYLYFFSNSSISLANDYINNDIDEDEFNKRFNDLVSSNETTIQSFPKLKIYIDLLGILKYYSNSDHLLISEVLNDKKGVEKKLIKLILIYNLIKEEDDDFLILDQIKHKMIQVFETGTASLDLVDNKIDELIPQDLIVNENILILKSIEKSEVDEGSSIEFKETIKRPVLTVDQMKAKKEVIDKLEKDLNIKDKQAHKRLLHSTFKNICAMLNSNQGRIIIGIRDDLSLVGLESDYELLENFDRFQQYFNDSFNQIMCEPDLYRRFVTLEKVTYKSKDFCFINIEFPNEFNEPCFIYNLEKVKDGVKTELCYVKAYSSTKELTGQALNKFRRVNNKNIQETNYVYIMKDSYGKFKIGHSHDIKVRRGTLMSQDSGIEVIETFKFNSKSTAKSIEKYLHNQYCKHRIRGEFFELSDTILNDIIKWTKDQSKIFDKNSNSQKEIDF